MTAPTNIKYNSTTANFGIMTAALASKIKETQALAARLNAIRIEVVAGDTPENLEATGSGFEVETGKGSDFNTFLGSIASHLADASFTGLGGEAGSRRPLSPGVRLQGREATL